MYLEEKNTLRIIQMVDSGLELDSDTKDKLVDLYLEL